MPLLKVIEAVTATPAKALNRTEQHQLRRGAEADITVLRVESCDMVIEDCQAQLRNVKHRIVPVAVWRAGEAAEIINREVRARPLEQSVTSLWLNMVCWQSMGMFDSFFF